MREGGNIMGTKTVAELTANVEKAVAAVTAAVKVAKGVFLAERVDTEDYFAEDVRIPDGAYIVKNGELFKVSEEYGKISVWASFAREGKRDGWKRLVS
jgi:hypothetical protein